MDDVETFAWILGGGVLMSLLALSGGNTLLHPEKRLQRLVLPLVALSAGSLLGGAFLHMLPAAHRSTLDETAIYGWVLLGFTAFFALEQLLHWHHCHRADAACRKPLSWLILTGDALHNFLGGMAVAGAFLTDIRVGAAAWLAAAAHEIPQELGDFGVLVHGGWSPRRALLFNLLSGATFLLGGILAFAASRELDVSFLGPFAAGNFIYIGASDLVPEIHRHEGPKRNALLFACFAAGVLLLWLVGVWLGP